jgi:hypothetical protein
LRHNQLGVMPLGRLSERGVINDTGVCEISREVRISSRR